jgi:hypothetical protein
MIGQYYSIKSPTGEIGVEGAFVFSSKSEDELIGFVYRVHGLVAEIVLFEPQELPENIIECKEMPCDYTEMLMDVIGNRACDEIKQMWIEACLRSQDSE